MLVRLKINRWGAKRNDSEIAMEVAKSKNSDAELGKFTKQLLKSDALDTFRKLSRQCRKLHKYYTLPWEEGVGLLPADMYFKYTEVIGEKQREAMKAADEFVAEYKEQWHAGLGDYKKGLGDMFNADDYPEPNRVRTKFGIHIRTSPIQDPNDFRVKMSADASEDLKKQMFADFQNNMKDAFRAPIIRLYEQLRHVQEKLHEKDAVFRDSLIGNIQELVEILPSLNVLNDPKIAAMIKQTEKEICSVSDVKALRNDPKYRKEVAKSADAILKSMKGYIS
jgi:hypothetical protein